MTLDELRALVEVINAGSINRAASQLGVPRTTLNRRLEALEADFGTPLLTISRDGALPTEAGARLATGAEALLRQAAQLDAAVRFELETPTRPITIASSPGVAPIQAAIFLEHWSKRMPGIHLHVYTQANPFRHGLDRQPDLIISIGRPRLGDYRVFQLLPMRYTFRASSAYLERHGTPTSVDDLEHHTVWAWEGALMTSGEGTSVLLRDGGALPLTPTIVLDDLHVLHAIAQRGTALVLVPSLPYVIPIAGLEPDEVEVLPGTLGGDVGLWAAVPERNANLAWARRLTTVVRDFFAIFESLIPNGSLDS
ncbi:MAG: LysR family transcriptional regulator [Myxococcota bacterium]